MKCTYCGGELQQRNGEFVCEYCNSTIQKKQEQSNIEINVNVAINSCDFDIRGSVLRCYNGNKEEVVIPEGVVEIGENAFKNNAVVKKVVFASTVKMVGKNAFEGCVNLCNIENYQSVQVFDDECFKGAGLEKVEIGENTISLGRYSFAGMPYLKTLIYTPKKDLKINRAFWNCPNLTEVKMDKFYFFPSFRTFFYLIHNSKNTRYTYYDAFYGTPYYQEAKEEITSLCKKSICPECGGKITKFLCFINKCSTCRINYKDVK